MDNAGKDHGCYVIYSWVSFLGRKIRRGRRKKNRQIKLREASIFVLGLVMAYEVLASPLSSINHHYPGQLCWRFHSDLDEFFHWLK